MAAAPNGIGFWWLAIQLWKDVFGLGGVAIWIATSFRTMRDSFKQAFRYDQRNEQG